MRLASSLADCLLLTIDTTRVLYLVCWVPVNSTVVVEVYLQVAPATDGRKYCTVLLYYCNDIGRRAPNSIQQTEDHWEAIFRLTSSGQIL